MAFVRTTLCAAFMVTVVISKPVPLGEGVPESAESSEESEESAPRGGLTQEPAFQETPVLAATEGTDPPGADAAGPSAVALSTAAPPDPEPQASIDASPLTPDGPSPTALGRDVSKNSSDSGPGHDLVLPDTQLLLLPGPTETDATIEGTGQAQVTTPTAFMPPHQGATVPFSTATPLPVPISTALTGLPVCFSFRFTTPEPEPPRGDDM